MFIFYELIKVFQILRASLVAPWWRICLPLQETWVRPLVRDDSTFYRATKPVCQKIERKKKETNSQAVSTKIQILQVCVGAQRCMFSQSSTGDSWWWAKIWTSTGAFQSFYNCHLVSACDEPGTLFFIIHNNPVKFLWYRKDEWFVQGPRASKFRRQSANQVLETLKFVFFTLQCNFYLTHLKTYSW